MRFRNCGPHPRFLAASSGHDLTIIEKSPSLRAEGYMIDFFSSGYDVAEKMGILDKLEAIHYPISRLAFLDGTGCEKYAISSPAFRRIFDDRHFNFMRGDLERVMRLKLPAGLSVKLRAFK